MSGRFASMLFLLSVLSASVSAPAVGQAVSDDYQIASALLAAPDPQRSQATVLGYRDSGEVVVLREGSNGLVCLSDNPADEGFSVACYHESLEPYMARGRELLAQGVKDGNERLQVRWREADAGDLAMPDQPATLYVLTGSAYDPGLGEVVDAYLRYVVYMPWATLESTGLPEGPMGPGGPWLMYPGTAGAHVMISPPRRGAGGIPPSSR